MKRPMTRIIASTPSAAPPLLAMVMLASASLLVGRSCCCAFTSSTSSSSLPLLSTAAATTTKKSTNTPATTRAIFIAAARGQTNPLSRITADGIIVRASTISTTTTITVPEEDDETTNSNEHYFDGINNKSNHTSLEHAIDFPPPLTKLQRLQRAAKFWTSALPIVFSYYAKDTELRLLESFFAHGNNSQPYYNSTEAKERIWNEQHARGARTLANTILSLQGFYVKTAQIIASRRDLFPAQYAEALSNFTDRVDPLPAELIQAVISEELLLRNERFEDVFASFDETPLGSASVAQVHRAVLTSEFGGGEVAVKVQRPAIESKLMGDIANLKALARTFAKDLPLDYYTVFCELEKQLAHEFDFVAEAVAMDRIYDVVSKDEFGRQLESPAVVVPRPVSGLVSRRVLVMDYLDGVPLSRAADEMLKRGISPDSPEAQLFGRKLLRSLTDVFGRCILETGFFHADPHAGNIFVLNDGRIGLIDFGQVKQIGGRARETLSKVMIALDDRISDDNPSDLQMIGNLALDLGVELAEGAPPEGPAAVAMWLFDGSVKQLPGGYEKGELSPNSPVKALKSFPQDLVLVGRSTILIKGLSDRLGIPWSLSKEWAPIARKVLESNRAVAATTGVGGKLNNKIRIRDVLKLLKGWGRGKVSRAISRLPSPMRTKVAAVALHLQKRKEAKEECQQ